LNKFGSQQITYQPSSGGPVYDNVDYWTLEELIAKHSMFKNVAAILGKTHRKDEDGIDLYVDDFDSDSEYVNKVMTSSIRAIPDSSPIKSKILALFAKHGSEQDTFLGFMKEQTMVYVGGQQQLQL
jgi:hypothetical protein